VRASKLLAAKRPHLIPIRDSAVSELLRAGKKWWLPMLEVVSDEQIRTNIAELSKTVPADVSVLRRLDVILWMEGTRYLKIKTR
jgi:hypothetical protein